MDNIVIKDCNTCQFHKQGSHPDKVCQLCMADKGYLPFWKHKETTETYDPFKGCPESCLSNTRSPEVPPSTPMHTQVGGDHYTSMKIQPIEFAIANNLDFFQKDIIKYITRRKGGQSKRVEDLKKAQHYLAMYIEAVDGGKYCIGP